MLRDDYAPAAASIPHERDGAQARPTEQAGALVAPVRHLAGTPPARDCNRLQPIAAALAAIGCDVVRHASEWEVRLPGETGHRWKINTRKRVVLDAATGRGYRLAPWLRRILRADPPCEAATEQPGRTSRGERDEVLARSLALARRWLAGRRATSDTREGRLYTDYLVARGFPREVASSLVDELQPVVHHAWPFGGRAPILDASGVTATAFVHTIGTPTGLPCVSVLALCRDKGDKGARKASLREWAGDARRTYGPRPIGSHFAFPPLRTGLLTLAGVPYDGVRVVVGEGLETTAALAVAVGGLGVVCVDAGHVASLLRDTAIAQLLVRQAAHIVVAVDVEPAGAGRSAAAQLLRLADEHHIPVAALEPPSRYLDAGGKADWADVLARDGLPGAEHAAQEAAEAALRERMEVILTAAAEAASTTEHQEAAEVRHLPILRREAASADHATPYDPAAAAERLCARRETLVGEILEVLNRPGARRLIAPPTGTGKSHAAAHAAARADAALLVGATRVARDQLAAWASATIYPARSGQPVAGGPGVDISSIPDDPGYCARYEELVAPLADRRRGIAPLACASCALGQAAMHLVAAWPEDKPLPPMPPRTLVQQGICSYIWHVEVARREATVAATCAKLASDPPNVATRRRERWHRDARAVIVDDCPALTIEETAEIADVLQWARVAARQAALDDVAAHRSDLTDEERLTHQRRADGLRALHPLLLRFGAWLLAHGAGESQVRIDPHEWADLTTAALDPGIVWVDATGAEAITRNAEGEREIPLRALQNLSRAIRRGVAWALRGAVVWHTPSPGVELLLRRHPGAVVYLDATPSVHLRRLVGNLGGFVDDPEGVPGNVQVSVVYAGSHGKAICDDGSPSQRRERDRLLSAIRAEASRLPQGASMAVVTHMALAMRVAKDYALPDEDGLRDCGYILPEEVTGRTDITVYLGWWGRHARAHNAWSSCLSLLCFGVPQPSPLSAERMYVSAEALLHEAGDPEANPYWNPQRIVRRYALGGGWTLEAEGWADERQDEWAREWTTAEVVQAIGRLRASARPAEQLRAVVYAAYPLRIRVDEVVTEAPWRTAEQRRAEERRSQVDRVTRAVSALASSGQVISRRAVMRWLRARGEPMVRPDACDALLGAVRRALPWIGGTGREYRSPAAVPPLRSAWRGGGDARAIARRRALRGVRVVLGNGWQERVLVRRLLMLVSPRTARGRGEPVGST